MKFVIYTPLYYETVGGSIVLHKLCHLLNQQGQDAKLWVYYKDKFVRIDESYPCPWPVESVDRKEAGQRVAIYPEIISGNPLRSQHVVRWFLHRPGFHTGEVNFGENELYFFYKPEFNDQHINPHSDHLLKILDMKEDIYVDRGNQNRQGFCHLVRKGKGRKLDYHPRGSIPIDGLTHQEAARVFNDCEFFISYDADTMFLRFATMCGCQAIIVPQPGVSRDEWFKNNTRRHGIAYGYDDLDWARNTRHLLLEDIRREADSMDMQVGRLVDRCRVHFTGTG